MVRDLYALDRIWKDIGTYRNQDYIAPNKAKVSIWQSFVRRACCIALGRDPVWFGGFPFYVALCFPKWSPVHLFIRAHQHGIEFHYLITFCHPSMFSGYSSTGRVFELRIERGSRVSRWWFWHSRRTVARPHRPSVGPVLRVYTTGRIWVGRLVYRLLQFWVLQAWSCFSTWFQAIRWVLTFHAVNTLNDGSLSSRVHCRSSVIFPKFEE